MNLSWDDLQTIEALVRTGTVQAAARELSLRHTSVSRRLTAIEAALGEPLFLRGAKLRPTPLAERIAERLGPMRKEVEDLRATVEGLRRGRAGRVVVTTSDVLAPLLFAGLRRARTDRTFEVIVTDREQELAPGVIDMALRPAHEPGGALRGRRLGTLRMGVFRGKGSGTRWVLPADSLRTRSSMRWWRAIPNDAEGALSCDSLLAMRDACAAGLGRAILPAFLAHDDPRLTLEREVAVGRRCGSSLQRCVSRTRRIEACGSRSPPRWRRCRERGSSADVDRRVDAHPMCTDAHGTTVAAG